LTVRFLEICHGRRKLAKPPLVGRLGLESMRQPSQIVRRNYLLSVVDLICQVARTGDVNGVALCRMFNAAISAKGVPKYLSSDNDPLFQFQRWQANLRILDIQEIKALPYVLTVAN
jgi:hypothetical protein